ncbi:MAG: hypothetical protein AB1578_17990 [Thermodesulfobacteriota bacterium]|jgi:type IV pilus assembly protein PilB
MTRKKRLGEILIDHGLLSETQLAAALNSQRTWGGKLGSTVVRMGFVSEEQILKALSTQLRLPAVDFRKVSVSPRTRDAISLRVAEKYNVVPVAMKEELGKKIVILAMSDPTNLDAISEIQFQTGVSVRPVVATESAINRAIDQYYRNRSAPGGQAAAPAGEQGFSYGVDRTVDLSKWDESQEMVIFHRDEEKRVSPLEGADALTLVRALVRVLEAKGVIRREDLEAALRSRP